MYGMAEDVKGLLASVSREIESLDIRIPEIHFQIPDFMKEFLASKSANDTTRPVFSTEAERAKARGDNGNGDPQPDPSTAIVAAALALATTVSDEQKQELT